MRIGLDARIASYNNSGISRYFWGLLSGLEASASEFDFVVMFSRKKAFPRAWGSHFTSRTLFTPPHNIFEEIVLPLEMASSKCDLVHGIDFYSPIGASKPQVVSIYDLYFLKSPEVMDAASYRHYSKVVRYAEAARHVICSSEATKKDLLELSSCKAENVSVVYPGSHEMESRGEVEPAILRQTNSPYLLFVGTIEPRKNIAALLEAYKGARQRLGANAPRLLLAGGKGFAADKILSGITELNLGEHVSYLGPVSEPGLVHLYRNALFIIYPSLYEGFGFPILEAFAAKKALLTSNVSSMPEVAGDAALLINPADVASLSAGIEQLAREPELRATLVAKGDERLKEFSWNKAAAETLALYKRAHH